MHKSLLPKYAVPRGLAMIQDSKHSVEDTRCACWSKEYELEDEGRFICNPHLFDFESQLFEDASTELIESGK